MNRDQNMGQVRIRVRTAACCLGAALLALAAGCRAPPAVRAAPAQPAAPAAATRFQLDAGASQLWLYLRAAGPLQRIGHSHVITTHALQGAVWLPEQIQDAKCEFTLPVAALVVDDPQERRAAGGEFAAPVDEEVRAGTREHMLSEGQLDAAHYALLSLQCEQVSAAADGALLQLDVSLRDHHSRLAVPVRWQRDDCTMRVSGEFSLRQTDLGLEPYSLMLGMLRVDDEVHARFSLLLHCRPEPAA